MKTAARICMIGALVGLLLASGSAWADTHIRIVRLSYLQGDVSIDLGQGAGSQRAVINMPVVEGARVWTGNDGQAEIEFEDGSTVRIAPNTTLTFTALSLRDSGGRVNTLAISGATAYVDIPKLTKEDEFTIQLPNRAITLTHSVHFRIDMDAMEARIAVFKGQLDVPGAQRAVDVRKGETLTLDFNDVERYNLASNVAALAFDGWDKDRDDTLREAGFNRNSQNYPYGYGYADLVNYGSFMNVGGYGSCWRPYGAAFSWDPFDYGYWAYYPRVGYTWVSGYPWGWAPYRYGGWTWMDSAGWSWCPRSTNNYYTWNIVPVVINPPPRWRPPHPPDKPSVGLPPIIPVGHRGPAPYRGGLISDQPGSGNSSANNGSPGEPGGRRGGRPGMDTSHFNGSGSGAPSTPTSGGPVVVVVPSDPPAGSGGEERGRPPRQNRGIDLTPPSAPSGRGGAPSSGGPIHSPVPVMRAPRGGPVGDSGSRIDRSGGGRGMESSRGMDASRPSAPSPMESSRGSAPAPSTHSDGPRMSPSPASGGGNSGGARTRPPVQ
jgi:hypothetical protein